MKLTIDITDEMYQAVKNGTWCGNELWYNALKNGIPQETVTEFADRCRECGARYGRLLNQKWIPVSERLPENDEDVLVCYPQGGMEVVYYHIDNSIYPTEYKDLNETGWCDEEGDALYFEPIAWMSLPEPYKAESEVWKNEEI